MTDLSFHLIRSIGVLPECSLVAQFEDGTIMTYEVKKLFQQYPVFRQLEDEALFRKVHVDDGGYGIVWNEDIDLDSNEIWYHGRRIKSKFEDLMAFSDATRIWGLNESTLRKALSYGKLVAGIDCCKYGKQWVISTAAMIREYGRPKLEFCQIADGFSWDKVTVAEKSVEYK